MRRARDNRTDGLDLWLATLVPSQRIVERHDQPSRALAAAVLLDAVRCLGGRGRNPNAHSSAVGERSRSRSAAEAQAWLLADCRDWPFAFLRVCEVLDLDPGLIREQLQDGYEAPYHSRRRVQPMRMAEVA